MIICLVSTSLHFVNHLILIISLCHFVYDLTLCIRVGRRWVSIMFFHEKATLHLMPPNLCIHTNSDANHRMLSLHTTCGGQHMPPHTYHADTRRWVQGRSWETSKKKLPHCCTCWCIDLSLYMFNIGHHDCCGSMCTSPSTMCRIRRLSRLGPLCTRRNLEVEHAL